MKRFLLSLLSSAILATPAFAIVGGPWDGGVPGNTTPVNPSTVRGTYQGSIKGRNLSGIVRFGTSEADTPAEPATTTVVVIPLSPTTNTTVNLVSVATVTGYATIFTEGVISIATVDVTVDLASRKIAGVLDGASTRGPVLIVSSTNGVGTVQNWSVTNNISLSGAFNGKLSTNWPACSFTSKGTLAIHKFDAAAFNAAAANDQANTNPRLFIATILTPIKVTGVKTSDAIPSFPIDIPDIREPIITPL